MKYPLIIHGEVCGSLEVSQNGLYTVVEAETKAAHTEVVRLWLHGGGESAYLGVMQPWSGGLYLRRKLSRAELAGFPKQIEYASDTGGAQTEAEAKNGEITAVCPYPAPINAETEELLWFSRGDGTLAAHDGISSLVAIPAQLRSDARGAVIRTINGGSYMIFRY